MSEAGVKAGKLLSVNVGLPRDVPWQGKTVRTAISKEPVEAPRMVRQIMVEVFAPVVLSKRGGSSGIGL